MRQKLRSQGVHFVNLVNNMPASTGKPDPVSIANSLRPILLQLNRQLRREAHPLGVTGGQVALLAVIRAESGVGLRELAAREGISPAGMSGHIDRLVRAGLVQRRRGTSGDRRRVGIELTQEGERVLRLVRSRRTGWLASRLERLEPDQLAAVSAALEPLAGLLGDPA
jgi:DNA-binding MarR family transcriptional regulator